MMEEKINNNKKSKIKPFVLLHILLLLLSVGGICSKLAAGQEFLSFKFCFFYGIVLLILFVYAIGWQQLLKHLPLVTAYANKAVTVIWGLIWGLIVFKEKITVFNIIGVVIIIAGVYLVVSSDEN